MIDHSKFIIRNPDIMQGKPTIIGTRITVELIVRKISEGYAFTELLEEYPHLNEQQLKAALAYAADVIAHEDVEEAV